MAKEIYKHTFFVDNVRVENGDLIIDEPTEYTYQFTLLMKGLDLFEREYGQPLIKALTTMIKETKVSDINDLENLNDNMDFLLNMTEGVLDGKFIRALACASYVKIENNQPINNEFTVEEFKELPVYPHITGDFEFLGKMMSMAINCVQDSGDKKKNNNQTKKGKN